jgi:hypothetical protein
LDTRRLTTLALALGMALACSSGTMLGATGSPPDLDADQVCALVDRAVVEAALDTVVTGVNPRDASTPQCSYDVEVDGTITNVLVAVMRADDDLGGRVGPKAFKFAVKLNKLYAGKAKITKVRDLGARATFFDGRSTNLLVVLADDGHVFTIVGGALDLDTVRPVAESALEGLAVA